MRVAAAQAEVVPGDVAGNAALAAVLVQRAADEGARVVVLPELFLPAYHLPTLAADPGTDVITGPAGLVDDARLEPLRDKALQTGATVFVGAATRDVDGRYIGLLMVQPDGNVVEAYRKQFLCGADEQRLFKPGRTPTVVEADGWILGLSICYDGCFPEHARAVALAGAEAYVCSVAYLVGSDHRRELYYRARAVENGMYVVLADAVGGREPFRFGGGSAVYDPEGRPLATATPGEAGVAVAGLSRELLDSTRAAHTMLRDVAADRPATGPVARLRVT